MSDFSVHGNYKPMLAGVVHRVEVDSEGGVWFIEERRKPGQAPKIKREKARFPLLASKKLDGIRCETFSGSAWTRTLKHIANRELRELLSRPEHQLLDMEITAVDPTDPKVFNITTSMVMSHHAPIDGVRFYVFDDLSRTSLPFAKRTSIAARRCQEHPEYLTYVEHELVTNVTDLLALEEQWVLEGYEGMMLNCPDAGYKFGRATLKEGFLLKFKRFEYAEAKVVGFEEEMRNDNPQETNELGYSKRSSCKDLLVPAGKLGALQVVDIETGVSFNVGTGYDDEERVSIWNSQEYWLGKIIRYKYFPIGVIDKPRFPSFQGERKD